MDFKTLKLDKKILEALEKNKYVKMTEIQTKVIPLVLKGCDVIGASQTGSGKTLAFILPSLQRLIDLKWKAKNGLGVLILTPTRELALQVFEVLKTVGKHLKFSAGLIMGGMTSENESEKISGLNILIATPGRLLQHLQENQNFETYNLQILVLDEADKMVEMGFKEILCDILDYLPEKKQTLLFSATPKASTAKILKMNDPEFVLLCKEESFPVKLKQFFYMMKPEQKLSYLITYLRNNIKKKGIVFFSTCKETKFYDLIVSKLRTGVKVFCLNGSMSQSKRLETFQKFKKEKHSYIFCTDVASRGLDFPNVDVVIQFDCPCNIETYVHRVGRTARNGQNGTGFMYLCSGEESIIVDIQKKKWAKGDFDQNNNNNTNDNEVQVPEISEGPRVYLNKIETKVRSLIKSNSELNEYCGKYLKTYEKFLTHSSKKYSEKLISKIPDMYEYFGLTKPEKAKR